MSFRRHTYPEVLDSLLTDITGGVAAETQPFPPPGASAPPYQHPLLKGPVSQVVSLYGALDGQPHLFVKDKDYKLVNNRHIEWQKSADQPDPGTLIYINYYPAAADPVLTDIETGSVVRTLAEAVSLEIASLSAQLDFVYKSAFIDTAAGTALDNVVALLGIQRVTGGSASGEVEFSRAPGSTGVISIPAGTRVATADGKVVYQTTESDSLAVGQNTARISARDLDAKNDPLPAGALSLLPVPIAGIGSVSNPAPTARLMRDESDDELRTRAKNFLHGSERATLGAIKAALAAEGIAADVVESSTPGFIDITPHVDALSPESRQRLVSAIDAVRPAGVIVRMKDAVPPVKLGISLQLSTPQNMVQKDIKAVQRAVQEKVADYLASLPVADPGSVNRLIGVVQGVSGVQDVKILSARRSGSAGDVPVDISSGTLGLGGATAVLGELKAVDPNLPTTLDTIVSYPKASAPADESQIKSALSNLIAYVNNLNATPLPAGAPASEQNKRKLSFGKLLLAVPLPNKPAASLAAFDSAAGQPPALPTDTTIKPYSVQFVFSQPSGLSQILSKAGDPDYVLQSLERLGLGSVQVQAES